MTHAAALQERFKFDFLYRYFFPIFKRFHWSIEYVWHIWVAERYIKVVVEVFEGKFEPLYAWLYDAAREKQWRKYR